MCHYVISHDTGCSHNDDEIIMKQQSTFWHRSFSTILMIQCDILTTDHLKPEEVSIFLAYNCKCHMFPEIMSRPSQHRRARRLLLRLETQTVFWLSVSAVQLSVGLITGFTVKAQVSQGSHKLLMIIFFWRGGGGVGVYVGLIY